MYQLLRPYSRRNSLLPNLEESGLAVGVAPLGYISKRCFTDLIHILPACRPVGTKYIVDTGKSHYATE